ncbi:MAG: winged helix-turn-helix transcriptional regulator [Peptostreptococcaceae bacterium]|nr:winged helix-turn-helix transcriptional regulator [Peptostreptococcaceae bacterium]
MRQVEIMKALADENRLRILNLLNRNLMCVCELETILELNQSNISRHLAKLRNMGIIVADKDAQWVHYRLDKEFKKENPELCDHMEKVFLKISICIEDSKRYENYLKHGFTCQNIRKDKEFVLKNIKTTEL